MSHRHLRFFAILAMVLAGSLGALQSLDGLSSANAQGEVDDQTIILPVRWCAVQGSVAASTPGTMNDVLLERTMRASDGVWSPGAQIEFQSAMPTADPLPVIPDPRDVEGNPGDIFDPREEIAQQGFAGVTEISLAVESCRAAWDDLASTAEQAVLGPIALNIGRFVDLSGDPTGLGGWGGYLTWSPKTAHPCVTPSGATIASGGFIAVEDFSVAGDPGEDGQLVAHELGHVLYLSHGNGIDDDGDTFYDQRCDPWELLDAPAPTLMHPGLMNATDVITARQRGTSRDLAAVYTGGQVETGAGLVSGPTVGDQRADLAGDVGAASVDLTYAELVVNPGEQSVTLTQGLLGTVGPDETNVYLAFLELDNNPATGIVPTELEFLSRIESIELQRQLQERDVGSQPQGIDLVVMIVVDHDRHASATVWHAEDEEFADVTGDVVEVRLTSPEGGEVPTPLTDILTIGLPYEIMGTVENQEAEQKLVGIQTVAANGQDLDVLQGAEGNDPSAELETLRIILPTPEG